MSQNQPEVNTSLINCRLCELIKANIFDVHVKYEAQVQPFISKF